MDLNSLNISITRKSFLRSIRIKITDDLIVHVVAGKLTSSSHIKKVLESHSKWIDKTIEKIKSKQALAKTINEFEVYYIGEKYRIEFKEELHKNIVQSFEEKIIYIDFKLKENYKKILEEWFLDKAKNFIPERVEQLNKNLNYKYEKISVRKQSTRWGSCSHKRNLSFNFKLIKAPLEVLDYVIYHELSHLKEFSHSKKFWELVEKSCPDYKIYRKWLRSDRYKL